MTEKEPLVSVVIPAYNAEKTLKRLLESLSAQQYTNLQILLADDGSTDGTLRAAREYAEKEPRLTVIAGENRGVGATRNLCLAQCRGKYIRFADADDTMPADSILRMVRRAEEDGADLVIGGFTEYAGELSRKKNLMDRDDTVPAAEMLRSYCWHCNSFFYGVLWNKLFRRDRIEADSIRFDEKLTWGEDFCFVADYAGRMERTAYLTGEIYDYRRSAGSASVRQVLDCVLHPLDNIHTKVVMYRHLKAAYIRQNRYGEYRNRLWMFLFRVGLG